MRRHHLVSRGYQRLFACGERILLCDKSTFVARCVGTRDAFVEKGFNAYLSDDGWNEDLEDEWMRLENLILPPIAALVRGDRGLDAEVDGSLKTLAAIHLVRSYAARALFDRILADHEAARATEWPTDPDLIAAFESQYGRSPNEGEIEERARELFDEHFGTNAFFVERLASMYNTAIDKFQTMHVQLVASNSRAATFCLGDSPVVHFSHDRMRVGLASGLAFLDADHCFMPIAPHLGMMLTTQPEEHQTVAPFIMAELNSISWRGARRLLALQPDADPSRALGHAFTVVHCPGS